MYGQLGIGASTDDRRFQLTMIDGLLCGRKCVSIGTGTRVSFAVTAEGCLAIQR